MYNFQWILYYLHHKTNVPNVKNNAFENLFCANDPGVKPMKSRIKRERSG